MRRVHQLIDRVVFADRKRIFLIDGLGALITSFLIGFGLGLNENLFGLPVKECLILSLIAFVFTVYSLSCFFLLKRFQPKYLLIIAWANLLYILLTALLVLINFETIKVIGVAYFGVETIVILLLVQYEMVMISNEKKNQGNV